MKKLIRFHLALMVLLLAQINAASPTGADEQKNENVRGLANISSNTSGNWDLFADALFWYASEEATAVWADILNLGADPSSFTPQNIAFDWKFGFRVGAGYNLVHDQWDTQFYWTWYRTKGRETEHVPTPEFIPIAGGGVLVTNEIHPEFFAADISSHSSQDAKIHWTLVFNMFDWELGRSYWVSKGLALRPFIGLKGGWIDQSIVVDYDNLIIADALTDSSAKEHVKNNFWGIGPVGGLNTKWKVRDFGMHFPSFFGDFSAATLWGTWACNDMYKETTGDKVLVKARNWTLGALMFRGFMGMGWDVDFNKGRSHFAIRVGYEMQLWVNQLRVATSQLVPLHGDLTLQGVTFNCRFDF